MRRTLSICLFVALAALLCGAVAEAGKQKQTDFPNLGLYIQVLDPDTGEPLMVLGTDKQPTECPPSQAPRDAIIRAIFLPNSGSRTTVCVKNREKDGAPEPEMVSPGPYFTDYYPADDARTYLIGPHIVKGVIRTDEGKWEPKAEVYGRTAFMADDIRYILPRARPAPQPAPEPARPQLVRALVHLTNGRLAMKVELNLPTNLVIGDCLVFTVDGEESVAKIEAITPKFKATMDAERSIRWISDADVAVRRRAR